MEIHPVGAAAIWGFLGAFIFAGPKWGAYVVAEKRTSLPRLLELAIALAIGAIAAAAYGRLALTATGISDENAVAATIGLVANTAAPAIVKRLTARLSRAAAGLAGDIEGKE